MKEVFLEVPPQRASVITELFLHKEWRVELHKDLAQRERILIAKA
jgi:hypothetical protein